MQVRASDGSRISPDSEGLHAVTRRRMAALLALAAPWGAAALPAFADAPIGLRDSAQHELRLEHLPRRVITLMPSLTETVCALDECEHLVATDRYSNWPAIVQSLPKAGGLDDAQIELIVGLKPDVVILAHATRVTARLRELGIATFDVETLTYADIARAVTAIGALLGVPEKAELLNRDIERSVDEVGAAATAQLHGRSPLVYFEVDSAPYAAGPQSFIGELLARLGARNILTPELGPFPKLNPEYVVRHDPDVIFVSPQEAPNLGLRPGWTHIRAVHEKRLCSFDPAVSDTVIRPGPRVAQGLRAMADCLVRVAP
jgi:iron complex transport system substrate-binding protein